MRSAREINNGMAKDLALDFLKRLMKRKINPVGLKVLLLGFTFKENCPDLRNTKVIELYSALIEMGLAVTVYDPIADTSRAKEEYGIIIEKNIIQADVGFLAVPHAQILQELNNKEISFGCDYCYDFKGCL
jgi:UDP-N-acetyl-D-galactosamine dehydrogenase